MYRGREQSIEGDCPIISNKLYITALFRTFISNNEDYVVCPNPKCGMVFERLLPSEVITFSWN